MLILVAILVGVGLVGWGIYYWNSKNTDNTSTTTQTSLTSSSSTASTTKSSTAQTCSRPTGSKTPTGTQGPYSHSIYSASSSDGETFKLDSETPILEHASVPATVLFPDGTIRVYVVDAQAAVNKGMQYQFACIESQDSGKTFQYGCCKLEGMTSFQAVDYSVVELSDKRYRMYYYASGQETDSKEAHSIDSAISTDGVTFTREGTVFTYDGLVDPDVFYTGKEWVLMSYSITKNSNVVATSSDGKSFTYKQDFPHQNYAFTKPYTLVDGSFRLYAFPQPNSNKIVSFHATDGFNWTLDNKERLVVDEKYTVTDPFVIKLADGTYKMFIRMSQTPAKKK